MMWVLAIAGPPLWIRVVVSTLLLLVCGACGGGRTYPWAEEPDPRGSEYVIGAADELDIRVWRNGDLSTEIAVRPDGRVTLPLIGDILVAGLTPTQVREEVAKRLTQYVKSDEAVVTVAVKAVNSYHVTVSGNVSAPGRFPSTTYLKVSDAIALAGGPTRFAEPEEALVIRRDAKGKIRRIPVDYEKIVEGKDDRQNIVLLRDDVVHVP